MSTSPNCKVPQKIFDHVTSFTPEVISKVIDYVITVPSEEAEKDEGYKFPFLCCDILTSEEGQIIRGLFEDEDDDEDEDQEPKDDSKSQ